jgi:hypothetical protein
VPRDLSFTLHMPTLPQGTEELGKEEVSTVQWQAGGCRTARPYLFVYAFVRDVREHVYVKEGSRWRQLVAMPLAPALHATGAISFTVLPYGRSWIKVQGPRERKPQPEEIGVHSNEPCQNQSGGETDSVTSLP